MEPGQTQVGQLSVRLLILAVCVAVAFLLIGGAASADTPPGPTTEYVVGSGDTLWAIAGSLTVSGADVRVTIDDIMKLSGITSSTLTPGQILTIPAQ